jgi:RpiR family carbohydrate utilization transcriptional regulator
MHNNAVAAGCLVRIQGLFSTLRNSEKKVAQYIQRNHEKVIHSSITEVAEEINTSESTVVRFCKALGYQGFYDFKIHLATEVRDPSTQIHESIRKGDDPTIIKKKIFGSSILAIQETLKVLHDLSFLKAVEILSYAKTIEFYGTGASGSVVLDAQHKFLKIGKKCFAYNDVDLQAMSATLLSEGDAVVAVSHSGQNKEVLEAIKLAKMGGASIISITNYGRSPITKVSDVVLFTSSPETAFKSDAISSRIAELVILDSLWAAIAFNDYDRAYKNIMKTRGATASKKL